MLPKQVTIELGIAPAISIGKPAGAIKIGDVGNGVLRRTAAVTARNHRYIATTAQFSLLWLRYHGFASFTVSLSILPVKANGTW